MVAAAAARISNLVTCCCVNRSQCSIVVGLSFRCTRECVVHQFLPLKILTRSSSHSTLLYVTSSECGLVLSSFSVTAKTYWLLCLNYAELWLNNNTCLIRQGWCFWQHLPASYSPYTIRGSCSQRHGSTSSWLTAAAVSADSEKSASTLRSRGKDRCVTWHLQSTQNVNPRSAHRVEAPSRTPSPHVATYPGSRSPAS